MSTALTPAPVTVEPPKPPLPNPTVVQLLRGLGGGRYAFATLISALGGGLIRPFLLLYAVTVSRLSASGAGLALSLGFLVGLAAVPVAGRWVDAGARRAVMVTTLALRAAGLLALLLVPGPTGFFCCCALQGIGNQTGPVGQAAVVAGLTTGYERDAVLAALRSLANGGVGAGALLATVALSSGEVAMHWLALGTAAGYLISTALVATVRLPAGADEQSRTGRAAITPADRPMLRRLTIMNVANLPFALCFDVLEVALPVVLVIGLHASPAWSSGIFVANTVMVILVQLPVVIWMSRRPRRRVFALSGLVLAGSYLGFLAAGTGHGNTGAVAIALVSVLYNLGEILYTGVGTALVIDAAPPHLRGRSLAHWQLSMGLGRALAPLAITAALTVAAPVLWLPLAALTLVGAAVIVTCAPGGNDDRRPGRRNADAALERVIVAHELRRSGYRPDRPALATMPAWQNGTGRQRPRR